MELERWLALVVAVWFQAFPFLVLGVALGALVESVLPIARLRAAMPTSRFGAAVAGGGAGIVLPGCECSSVPVAGRLAAKGLPTAGVVAFLLAAPAVNPVVLVATAVAFPGSPEMVLARLVASLAAAVFVGVIFGRSALPLQAAGHGHGHGHAHVHRTDEPAAPSRRNAFLDAAGHDLVHAGAMLTIGAVIAATLQVVAPGALSGLSELPMAAQLGALAILAVVLAICSEADAFVAASLLGVHPVARLAFLVVGPMVDVKLVAMQAGTFGVRFTARFAPVVFLTATMSALIVGSVILR